MTGLYIYIYSVFPSQATCGLCSTFNTLEVPKDWYLTNDEPPCHDALDLCPYVADATGLCSTLKGGPGPSIMALQCSSSCGLCKEEDQGGQSKPTQSSE